jgi:hypothetical protein
MPVCGKKLYQIYLSEKETAYIKEHIHSVKGQGGFSALMDSVVLSMHETLKKREPKDGRKYTWKRILKLWDKDIKQS